MDLWGNFKLGASGLADLIGEYTPTNTLRSLVGLEPVSFAAEEYAAQTAAQKGLSAEETARLAQQAQAANANNAVLKKAASNAVEQAKRAPGAALEKLDALNSYLPWILGVLAVGAAAWVAAPYVALATRGSAT